jgi:hypothetical protein
MKANPENFQAIAIGKQTKQQNLTFIISTKVSNKWAIVKVGHNKGVVDCKFS